MKRSARCAASSFSFAGSLKAGIKVLVPEPLTSNSNSQGRLDKRDFVYDAQANEYRYPAGERAIWRFSAVENGLTLHKYWPSACPNCSLRE